MKKIFLITLLALLASAALTAEGGIDFSGEVSSRWGVAAPWTDSDTAAGRFTIGDLSFTGTIDAYYDKSSALAEGSLSYDAVKNELSYSMDELWVDYTDSFWGIRIGRQKSAWGKADGIDITNVLCPSDMSSLAAMTNDDSKLGVDAIRLSFSGNSFTADAWWIPFFTPTALPLDEGNSLRQFVIPDTVSMEVAPGTSMEFPVKIGLLEKPELAIWNGEYGLKLSGYFSALDLSLYGFYGWDDIPLLNYQMTAEGILVSGQYERMAMIGADAALPIGPTVLRLEAAFFPQRYFQKSSGAEKRNQLSALAGIDWMPSGWTLTAQYYCDYVFEDLDELERTDAYQHGATLSISKSLVNFNLDPNSEFKSFSIERVSSFNEFNKN